MEQLNEKEVDVTIFVNGSPFKFESRKVTGLQIKTKAGADPGSELYRKSGEKLTLIDNEELIKIRNNEEFVDFPPTPVS